MPVMRKLAVAVGERVWTLTTDPFVALTVDLPRLVEGVVERRWYDYGDCCVRYCIQTDDGRIDGTTYAFGLAGGVNPMKDELVVYDDEP
jgi:hypothetical protein